MALACIVLNVVFTVSGQLALKYGMSRVGHCPAELKLLPAFVLDAFTNRWVLLGFLLAVVAAITWMLALSRCNLSFAYSFIGLAIILVMICSQLCFSEHIPLTRWIGVGMVCLGVWLAAK